MAKGFEDTTLYVYNRLISLNEVGGEPFAFGIAPEKFHDFNVNRADKWPSSMSALSTHDTKRGEDTRARINVLSEIPDEWEFRLKAWNELNRELKENVADSKVPSLNDEYFLYQTLIGAFPFGSSEQRSEEFRDRIKEYTIKAIREAKDHTGWIKPDADYENGYMAFLDKLLDFEKSKLFWEDFIPFQKRLAHFGILNSLAQTLIKITSPGIPDFFQGSELWDLSLVDPDNRRPVDFDIRKTFLTEIMKLEGDKNFLMNLMAKPESGKIKLFLSYRALFARRENQSLFEKGDYIPLRAEGTHADRVFGFARRDESSWAITIIPRLLTNLVTEGEYPLGEKVWENTSFTMPEGCPSIWENAITGEKLRVEDRLHVSDVFSSFPVALILAQ
jgi:(1->4)-alpha-D-glucan 1-alpha-D-glucosylmutase